MNDQTSTAAASEAERERRQEPDRRVRDVTTLRDLLRREATRLGLDPASVASPTPNAITAKAPDGTLLRLDVSRYQPMELSL